MLTRVVNLTSLLPQLVRVERRYRRLMRTELPADFERLRRSCKRMPLGPHEETKKYLRAHWYLREGLCRARSLGLHRGRSLRILDLGSGAGYFLVAARSMGHEVYGFDLDDNELYNRIIAALGLQRFAGRIDAFERLALPHLTYDLITAFSITFDRTSRRWRRDEWQFLLRDLRRMLADDGRIFLRLNRHVTESSSELEAMFVGAEGFDCRVCDFRSVMLARALGRRVADTPPPASESR
jgi:SAM-dependent methyltransferase